MLQLFHCLFRPSEYLTSFSHLSAPAIVLGGGLLERSAGRNSLFHRVNNEYADQAYLPGNQTISFDRFAYNFLFRTLDQRILTQESVVMLDRELADRDFPLEDAASLFPFITILIEGNSARLYRFVDQSQTGGVSLCFAEARTSNKISSYSDVITLLEQAFPALRSRQSLLNDNCWLTKWRSDYELERKYTFTGIPDTWLLINKLYQQVLNGDLPGFIPEIDMEFQVFDYESHVFEINSPDDEAGYISFIPQCDGLMTVKRKWFRSNSELRKETVWPGEDINFDEIGTHVKSLTDGKVSKLSAFRRKRFDINFESMETGHIFGVYFDICRIADDEAFSFSQCEVEYCRSRTLFDLEDVMDNFETVAEFTRQFLVNNNCVFEHNLYSKLDFVRSHAVRAPI